MSNAALSWAFPIPITGPRKAVLIALAEHANDQAECWPTVSRLVLFSGSSERTVRTSLKELEVAGLIRVNRSGGHTVSRYLLVLNSAPAADLIANMESPKGRKLKSNGAGGAVVSARGAPLPTETTVQGAPKNGAPAADNGAGGAANGAPAAPKPLKPLLTLIEPSGGQRPRGRDQEHDSFWKIYPRKKEGQGACHAAWLKARKAVSFEVIMDGLRRYPFNPEFLPMASTWLNQKRWMTEADTPIAAAVQTERSPANPTGRILSEIAPW